MSNRFVSIYKLPITDEDIKRVVARIAAKETKHHKDPMDPNSVQYELVDWCDSAARELNIEARCQRGGIETVISLVKVLAAIVDCVKAEATKRGHFFPGAEDDPVKEKLWAWIGQHKQHLLNLPVRTDSRKTYSDSTPEPKQGDKGRECVISTLDIELTGKTMATASNEVVVNGRVIRVGDASFCLLLRLVVALSQSTDGWVHKEDLIENRILPGKHPHQAVYRLRQSFKSLAVNPKELFESSGDGRVRLSVEAKNIQFNRATLLTHHDSTVKEIAKMLPDDSSK